MIKQELIDYIKKQLEQGLSKEEIKNLLLTQGWQEKDIEEAFDYLSGSPRQSTETSMPSQQKILSLPSINSLLSQAWSIYKKNLNTFCGIVIIPLLISLFASLIIIPLTVYPFFNLKFKKVFIIWLFLFLIIFIFQIWSSIALIYAIKYNEENISAIESYRQTWRKIPSFLWLMVLQGFIVFAGILCFIIPGIILAIYFIFSNFVLIDENLKGTKALSKSMEYVKGKWFSVFWYLLFIDAIFLISMFIMNFIFAFLKMSFFSGIINALMINFFFKPLITIYSFLLYRNLKTLKEKIC